MSNGKIIDHVAMDANVISSGNYSSLTARVDKLHYVREIHNYSFLDAKGETLRSPIFTAATNDKCKWYLFIDPTSSADFYYTKVGIGLDRTSECKVAFVQFSIFILDSNRKNIHSKASKKVNRIDVDIKDNWGYTHFILKEYLCTDKFTPNNKLTIYLEATFSDAESSFHIPDQSISNHIERCVLKDDLSEDLEQLLKSQNFTDIVISVNGERFQAHKYILAARSPVFAAMFKHDTKESNTNEVEITDIDKNVVEEMLHYMYTGKFQNLDTLASELLKAADKYGMEVMKAKCENALLKNLSVENAADTLVLADLYHANELKSRTINFIVANPNDVANTKNWNEIVPLYPHLINEVFRAQSRQYT